MSNSERHQEKRRLRALQREKDNRIHRNALRKHFRPVREPQELTIRKPVAEAKLSLWERIKGKLKEIPRKILPTKSRR